MNNNNTELCTICHENLENELYVLPECNHTFHTNCIITWFRMNNCTKKCPLCNTNGINSIIDVKNALWFDRKIAMENYQAMKRFSKKKDAPKQLITKIERLKKMEDKLKEFKADLKEFKNKIHTDLTAKQILTKNSSLNTANWHLKHKIRTQKELIGFQQQIIKIIIPVKQEV